MEERRHHSRLEPAQRKAFVFLDARAPLLDCDVINISDAGARIACELMLPTRFLLFFTADGLDRRSCRIVWRDGLEVGVVFE
jgi:hypothetical protein